MNTAPELLQSFIKGSMTHSQAHQICMKFVLRGGLRVMILVEYCESFRAQNISV